MKIPFSANASIVWFWRKKHSGQAAVVSHNRTRQRETVFAFIQCRGEFHIIWIFHGYNQKKVKVHTKYAASMLRWSWSAAERTSSGTLLDRTVMPNIKAGQNILFLCAFLAHFGATMQEWLAQPNLSSRIGLKGFAAPDQVCD